MMHYHKKMQVENEMRGVRVYFLNQKASTTSWRRDASVSSPALHAKHVHCAIISQPVCILVTLFLTPFEFDSEQIAGVFVLGAIIITAEREEQKRHKYKLIPTCK